MSIKHLTLQTRKVAVQTAYSSFRIMEAWIQVGYNGFKQWAGFKVENIKTCKENCQTTHLTVTHSPRYSTNTSLPFSILTEECELVCRCLHCFAHTKAPTICSLLLLFSRSGQCKGCSKMFLQMFWYFLLQHENWL